MEFTRDELRCINNALNEVLNGPDAIEDWEFHSRLGYTKNQTRDLLRMVKELAHERGRDTGGVEPVDRRGNLALVHILGRRFPALAIQGDTFSTLLNDLEEELPEGYATRTVRNWLAAYEDMMAATGRSLPYHRP